MLDGAEILRFHGVMNSRFAFPIRRRYCRRRRLRRRRHRLRRRRRRRCRHPHQRRNNFAISGPGEY